MVWAKEGSRNWVPTPNWTPAVGIPVGRDFTLGRPQPAQDPSTVHHHAWSPSEEPRGRKTPGSEDPTPNPNRFQIVCSAVVTQVREIRALRLRRSVGEKRPHLKGEQPEEPPWSRRRRSLFNTIDGGVPPNNAKTKLFRQRRTRSERERGVGDRRRTDKVAGKLKLWQWDPPKSLQSSCILKPSQPNQNYCLPVRLVTYVVLPYQNIIIHQRIAFRFVLGS